MRYIIAFLFLFLLGCYNDSEEKHVFELNGYSSFYRKFERMVLVANPKMKKSEIMGLGTAIWEGCDGSYQEACLFASIGVAESHYRVQKTYNRFKGYHGAHNGTIFAAAKREGVKKAHREELLKSLETDRVLATYYSARQYAWLKRIYGSETLKIWVGGERWKTNKSWMQRAIGYERMVLKIHRDWFSEEGKGCGNNS